MGNYSTICELRGAKPFSKGCTALAYTPLPYCALRARARRNADDPQYNCISGDPATIQFDQLWILRTGVWNDVEPWDDLSFWKDAA